MQNRLQYYPTPSKVAKRMLDLIPQQQQKKIHSILDPSAGSGNLLNVAYNLLRPQHLYAFEIDEERHQITKSREFGYKVYARMLGYDFLHQTQRVDPLIDLMIINPPFNAGADHLLAAIHLMEQQPKCAHILCLLNKETIENPHTATRQHLSDKIEELGGQVFQFGKCFKKVNAEVVCVKIMIQGRKLIRDWTGAIDFETVAQANSDARTDLMPFGNGIAITPDELQARVTAYECSLKAYSDMMLAHSDLERYTKVALGNTYHCPNLPIENDWGKELTLKAWVELLETCTRRELITSELKFSMRDAFSKDFGGYSFTMPNILRMFAVLAQSRKPIIHATVKEVFRDLTFSNGQTLQHNRSFKMASKFILVYIDSHSIIPYAATQKLEAIDKMMCLLSNTPFGAITSIADAINKDNNLPKGPTIGGKHINGIDTTFFKVLRFRNGNLRFWVKESAAPYWQEANRIAGELYDNPLGDGTDWKVNHKWAPDS